MSGEIKKCETRVQKYNQASQIIRIKKKRRKRDLDQVRREVLGTRNKSRQRLHCNIENSLRKTTNTFTRARQNNANQTKGSTRKNREKIKQKTSCERLLPQLSIGIYRNGTSGKQMKKQNKISLSENKNERRLPGDVMELFNGEGHLFKKSEDVRVFEENYSISYDMKSPVGYKANKNSSPQVTMVEAEFEKVSIDDEKEVNLINKMNTKYYNCNKVLDSPSKNYTLQSTPIGNDEIVNNGLDGLQYSLLHKNLETSTNQVIQSVGRWRWSPVNCFEEFCAKMCIERFVNCPYDGVPDPIEGSKMILKDLYLKNTAYPDCDFHRLCKNDDNFVPNIMDNKSYFDKMKQNNVDRRWYMNCNMIPDWMTPDYKNQSIVRQDADAKFPIKTTVNEVSKEKRRKVKLSMPIEAENSSNFIKIFKNPIKNSRKRKEFNFPLIKTNHSNEYDNNYKKHDDFSHKAINHYHSVDYPSMANSYINNESLKNEKYQMIQTPSVVYRMIRDNKIPNKPKLNHTKAIYKEKKHRDGDKMKNVNCEKFDITKDIFENIPDKVSYEPNNRHKSNNNKFYGDNQSTLHHKLKGRSEKSGEIPQFELLKFVKNNAHCKSIGKSLELRLDKTRNWQNKVDNDKHDYEAKGKVFSFHDDYFNQMNNQPIGNKKLKYSRQMEQPTKYFAVKNNHNLVDLPQRIAIYPHEYPHNYNDNIHCTTVRKPYYQSADNLQVIEPSLIDTPVVMFDSEKKLYNSKFHTVDAVNNTQSKQDERAELSREKLWIDHKCLKNDQSRIDHLNQINQKAYYWPRDQSYYFH